MITRIEIDGFKSLRDFSMDLEPFTVLVGPNSAGKSNVLEALMLLSRLASMPVVEAFKGGRGRVLDQFTRGADGPGRTIRFVAETLTLTPSDKFDDEDVQTRLRYELVLERQPSPSGVDRIGVKSECLRALLSDEDEWVRSRPSWSPYARYGYEGHIIFQQSAARPPTTRSRQLVELPTGIEPRTVKVPRTQTALAWYPHAGPGKTFINIKNPETMALLEAIKERLNLPTLEATLNQVVRDAMIAQGLALTEGEADISSSDGRPQGPDPVTTDLRNELMEFRSSHLDSTRLREPSERVGADEGLAPDASNLPTVLAELAPEALGALRADLVSLVPGLSSFDAVPEEESFRIDFEFSGGERLPARVVSDGTLRLLAMLTALRAEPSPSLLGIEEPENGIYPGRLRALLELLQELSLRPERALGAGRAEAYDARPQIVLTTHSPVLLAALHSRPECLRFLNVVRRDGRLVTHVRKVARSVKPARAGEFVSLREVERLLDSAKAEVAEAGE
ncbi:MAG TPA: ATP-binding protein [Polyangiaceae bacterium]|nr:ATP-binding protein [Polyangiaceae bacterium]